MASTEIALPKSDSHDIVDKITKILSKYSDSHKLPLPQIYIDRLPDFCKTMHPSLKTSAEIEEIDKEYAKFKLEEEDEKKRKDNIKLSIDSLPTIPEINLSVISMDKI
jgi:hypothetical protein